MTIAACLKSMRLRTLPLSLSGIIIGISLASKNFGLDVLTVLFLLLTTCFLQILSNLSNELGDTLHGTDTADRQGMHYAVMDGEMTVDELKGLVKAAVVCCCACGLLMIWFSFGTLFSLVPVLLMLLGAAAIVAAMRYTLGPSPYGYRGFGDLFVFIFFGLVSTLGAFFVCSHSLSFGPAVLPACAVGLFSIGVLNVNNIRDMKTDMKTRTTVAIKLGAGNARIYQTVLICGGWVLLAAYSILSASAAAGWLYFITLPLFALHLKGVWTRTDRALDPMLPLLVMSTFLLSLIFLLTN